MPKAWPLLLASCYMDQEAAFWTFVCLMQDPMYRLRVLSGPGVGGLYLLMFQIDHLVQQMLPEVWAHLEKEMFGVDVYVPPFIPSLFIGRVKSESSGLPSASV